MRAISHPRISAVRYHSQISFTRDVSAYSSYDQWCCSTHLKCVKGLSRRKIYVLCGLYRAQGKSKPDCVHNFPVGITVAKYEVHSRVQIALSHTVQYDMLLKSIDKSFFQIEDRGVSWKEENFFYRNFFIEKEPRRR